MKLTPLLCKPPRIVTPSLCKVPPTVTNTLPVVPSAGTSTVIDEVLQLSTVVVDACPLNTTVLVPCVGPKFIPVIVNLPAVPKFGVILRIVGESPETPRLREPGAHTTIA